jgi:hypothetical protein
MDATSDKDYQFEEFMKLARWAETHYGIRLVQLTTEENVDLSELIPEGGESSSRKGGTQGAELKGGKPFSRQHGVIARVLYPRDGRAGPSEGYLVLMKSNVTRREPLQLLSFYQLNEDFPHDSSADQFYSADRFESYVQLGYCITDACCGQASEDLVGRSAASSVERFLSALVGEALPAPPQPASTAEEGDAADAHLKALLEGDAEQSRAAVQRLSEMLVAGRLSRESRRCVTDAFVATFEKSEDPLRRLIIAQVLKLRPTYTRRVRAAAVEVSLNVEESTEIRLAALDLLASIGLRSKAARNAVQKLTQDSDLQVAKTAAEIFASSKPAQPKP